MTHFTCLSCRVGFSSNDAQRQHYKTDWHRYNLKRKIAGMIPVSADNFRERVAAQERDKEAQVFFPSKSIFCESHIYRKKALGV